jgi:copper transporter 1
MGPAGRTAGLLVALMALACLAGDAAALGLEPSANMTDACYTTPSDASCATFQRTDAEWSSDLEKLCQAMPFMVGCSMWKACTDGKANAQSSLCSLTSIAGNICGPDEMGKMKGCEAWNALCAAGTKVEQCLKNPPAVGVPTTYNTKADIDGVCTTHSMDGCQECTSVGNMNFRSCPEVFNIYGRLCVSMPDMETCAHWKQFCANQDAASAFPMFCTGDAADGSSSAIPPMKMWFHQGTREMFLFKEWVPDSTGQYVGLCIAMCVLAVFTQFLKAVRLRVEMHWSALTRARACDCDADVESGCGQSTKHLPMGMGNKSMATTTPAIPPPKACCGGAATANGDSSSSSADEPVPTSSKRKYWLCRGGFGAGEGALVVGGRQLMTRWQAEKNFYRAVFTFVVMFLDYALMLVVMTFNVGIILAVCGGFAIGALLFGHAGEPGTLAKSSQKGVMTLAASQAPLTSQNTSEEMETVFVEGAGCCSGGSGYGGGGHCGGQL